LNAKKPRWGNTSFLDEVVDHLLEYRGLADLAGSAEYDNRSDNCFDEPGPQQRERPTLESWENSTWLSLPPGVCITQQFVEFWRQPNFVKQIRC